MAGKWLNLRIFHLLNLPSGLCRHTGGPTGPGGATSANQYGCSHCGGLSRRFPAPVFMAEGGGWRKALPIGERPISPPGLGLGSKVRAKTSLRGKLFRIFARQDRSRTPKAPSVPAKPALPVAPLIITLPGAGRAGEPLGACPEQPGPASPVGFAPRGRRDGEGWRKLRKPLFLWGGKCRVRPGLAESGDDASHFSV